MTKEQAILEATAFMHTLTSTGKQFGELNVYVGDNVAVNKLGTVAACIITEDKPFIFIANSKVLNSYDLNKKEIKAIMYHECAHYSLGHMGHEHIGAKSFEEYLNMEMATDIRAVEIAAQNGMCADKAAFTLSMALAKMGMKMVLDVLKEKKQPDMQNLEGLDRRVDNLIKNYDKTPYMSYMKAFEKRGKASMVRIAQDIYGMHTQDDIVGLLDSMG